MTYRTKNENGYNLEEMVASLKSGDSNGFEPLFLRFMPLIRKFSGTYQIRSMDEDDFIQEARIVLHHALKHYQKGKGLQFAAYYKLLLQNRVYSMIRKETALKRTSDRQAVSFDLLEEREYLSTSLYAQEQYHMSPEYIVQAREATNESFAQFSDFEREVLSRYLTGKLDMRAIAAETNRTLEQVQHAYDRCMQKLKKNLR